MRARTILTIVLCSLVFSIFGTQAQAGKKETSVLVIPPRYRIVQLATDISTLRPVFVISYQQHPKTEETILHLWNDELRQWTALSTEEFQSYSFARMLPANVIVVGTDEKITKTVADKALWAPNVEILGTLDIASIINSVGDSISLKPRDLKWLSKRYSLTSEDLNAERRRWGKYGRPGTKHTAERPAEDAINPEAIELAIVESSDTEEQTIVEIEEENPLDK